MKPLKDILILVAILAIGASLIVLSWPNKAFPFT